jgi:3-hydroxybutyryl-CoA dehydratase
MQSTNPMQKGDKFTVTFKVDDAVYSGFKALFKDLNPLHTDADFAKQKGFKDRVMHGNILGGFLSYFIGECLPTKDVVIHSQEIKYLNPIYLGDELFLTANVEDVFESVNVVEFKFIFENQDRQKVAKGRINIGLL